ncbi:hypothetical protein [Shimia abyssi]|uniref:hypothetical protein n=1 Tax=Shimia abyssi TaxID=1662395 RepID=UPI00105732A6|nr:hypothetical protein [Shimia abyssi]
MRHDQRLPRRRACLCRQAHPSRGSFDQRTRRNLAQWHGLWQLAQKTAGQPSEITEDAIRKIALPMGLVDVEVRADDKTWSGLKLAIRKELR